MIYANNTTKLYYKGFHEAIQDESAQQPFDFPKYLVRYIHLSP